MILPCRGGHKVELWQQTKRNLFVPTKHTRTFCLTKMTVTTCVYKIHQNRRDGCTYVQYSTRSVLLIYCISRTKRVGCLKNANKSATRLRLYTLDVLGKLAPNEQPTCCSPNASRAHACAGQLKRLERSGLGLAVPIYNLLAYLPFAQMQLLAVRRKRLESLHKLIGERAVSFTERAPAPTAGQWRVHRRGRISSERSPSYCGWRRLGLDVVSHSDVQGTSFYCPTFFQTLCLVRVQQ